MIWLPKGYTTPLEQQHAHTQSQSIARWRCGIETTLCRSRLQPDPGWLSNRALLESLWDHHTDQQPRSALRNRHLSESAKRCWLCHRLDRQMASRRSAGVSPDSAGLRLVLRRALLRWHDRARVEERRLKVAASSTHGKRTSHRGSLRSQWPNEALHRAGHEVDRRTQRWAILSLLPAGHARQHVDADFPSVIQRQKQKRLEHLAWLRLAKRYGLWHEVSLCTIYDHITAARQHYGPGRNVLQMAKWTRYLGVWDPSTCQHTSHWHQPHKPITFHCNLFWFLAILAFVDLRKLGILTDRGRPVFF